MIGGGDVLYRCRLCGATFTDAHVPDVVLAATYLSLALRGGELSNAMKAQSLFMLQPIASHACAPEPRDRCYPDRNLIRRTGLADAIGFRHDEPPCVPPSQQGSP